MKQEFGINKYKIALLLAAIAVILLPNEGNAEIPRIEFDGTAFSPSSLDITQYTTARISILNTDSHQVDIRMNWIEFDPVRNLATPNEEIFTVISNHPESVYIPSVTTIYLDPKTDKVSVYPQYAKIIFTAKNNATFTLDTFDYVRYGKELVSYENKTIEEMIGDESGSAWEVFSKSQVLMPVDIAFDSRDNMYVLHSANRIKVLDPTGKTISNWDALTQFTKGSAISVDKSGNVFVIATDLNKILKYDSNKNLVMTWPLDSKESFGTLDGILGFDIDDENNIYIADMDGSRILKLDGDGYLTDIWGNKGKNEGQFLNPKGVFVDDLQNVYVADSNNYRIQKFDSDGNLLDLTEPIYDKHGIRIVPESIVVDSSGDMFVANDDSKAHDTGETFYGAAGNVGKVWKLGPDGKIKQDWAAGVTIRGLGINHAGELFAADIGKNEILHLKTGSKTSLDIPVWIKNNAKWWAQGEISDFDFVGGTRYLIQENIMKIPETKPGLLHMQTIPDWVKTTAGWWAGEKISDNEFVIGIQYLIANGIIKI